MRPPVRLTDDVEARFWRGVQDASGMTAPHRLKDLADVLEVIRTLRLREASADDLHPYVRQTFRELWRAAQINDPE